MRLGISRWCCVLFKLIATLKYSALNIRTARNLIMKENTEQNKLNTQFLNDQPLAENVSEVKTPYYAYAWTLLTLSFHERMFWWRHHCFHRHFMRGGSDLGNIAVIIISRVEVFTKTPLFKKRSSLRVYDKVCTFHHNIAMLFLVIQWWTQVTRALQPWNTHDKEN